MSLRAEPAVLWRAISRMVSTDSCLAVSMKEQVLMTRISACSGCAVSRAPARSSRPIITSESTRFLGQPNEIKPTVGAVGEAVLVTLSLYRELKNGAESRACSPRPPAVGQTLAIRSQQFCGFPGPQRRGTVGTRPRGARCYCDLSQK